MTSAKELLRNTIEHLSEEESRQTLEFIQRLQNIGLANSTQFESESEGRRTIPAPQQPQAYYEGSVLVVESESMGNLDIIDDLREERIAKQISW